MKKYLSKLCKENKPEACIDCLSIRCICTCHKKTIFDEDEEDNLIENEFKFRN